MEIRASARGEIIRRPRPRTAARRTHPFPPAVRVPSIDLVDRVLSSLRLVDCSSQISSVACPSPSWRAPRVLQKGSGGRREKGRGVPSSVNRSRAMERSDFLSILPPILRAEPRCAAPTSSGLPGPAFRVCRAIGRHVNPREGSRCPIVSTYRYTHGNLSQELVAIVIN